MADVSLLFFCSPSTYEGVLWIRFNADELGIHPASMKMLSFTAGDADVRNLRLSSHLTVVITTCANGQIFPTGYIVQGSSPAEVPPYVYREENCWGVASANGYIDEEIFLMQFVPNFLARLRAHRVEHASYDEYALLVLDGHSSRMTWQAMLKLALERTIVVVLPSHTTHVLQPNDAGVNKWFKEHMLKRVEPLLSANVSLAVSDLCALSLEVLALDSRKVIVRSFEHCGLHPLQKEKVLSMLHRRVRVDNGAVLAVASLVQSQVESLRSVLAKKRVRDLECSDARRIKFDTKYAKAMTNVESIAMLKIRKEYTAALAMKKAELLKFMRDVLGFLESETVLNGRTCSVARLRGKCEEKMLENLVRLEQQIERRLGDAAVSLDDLLEQ